MKRVGSRTIRLSLMLVTAGILAYCPLASSETAICEESEFKWELYPELSCDYEKACNLYRQKLLDEGWKIASNCRRGRNCVVGYDVCPPPPCLENTKLACLRLDEAWNMAENYRHYNSEDVEAFKQELANTLRRAYNAICASKKRKLRRIQKDLRTLWESVEDMEEGENNDAYAQRYETLRQVRESIERHKSTLNCGTMKYVCQEPGAKPDPVLDFIGSQADSMATQIGDAMSEAGAEASGIDAVTEGIEQINAARCVPEAYYKAAAFCMRSGTQQDCQPACAEMEKWLKELISGSWEGVWGRTIRNHCLGNTPSAVQ